MTEDERLKDRTAKVMEWVAKDLEGFWLIIEGKGSEERRREALLTLTTEAWGSGYAEGLRNGAEFLRQRVAHG